MPLVKGKRARSKRGIRENTEREIEAGRDPRQAYAIAHSVARRSHKRRSRRSMKRR